MYGHGPLNSGSAFLPERLCLSLPPTGSYFLALWLYPTLVFSTVVVFALHYAYLLGGLPSQWTAVSLGTGTLVSFLIVAFGR